MNSVCRPLNDDAIRQIDKMALRVLTEVGFRIPCPQAQRLLAQSGQVDIDQGDVCRVQPSLVKHALDLAPKQFVLAGRSDQRLSMGTGNRYHFAGAEMLNVQDSDDTVRVASLQDLVKLTILADKLDQIDGQYAMVVPSDSGPHEAIFRQIETLFLYSSKHIGIAPAFPAATRCLVELAARIEADLPTLPGRIAQIAISPNAPLLLDPDTSESLIIAAQNNIPITTLASPMLGTSGPLSLFGSLTQACAEALLSLTLIQLAKPGAAMLWGMGCAATDMRTGSVVFGSPEPALLSAASAQVARYYNLPSYWCTTQTDSCLPSFQCGMEKVGTFMAGHCADHDLTLGAASLAKSTVASPAQLVLDNEIIGWVRRATRDINADSAEQDFQLIKRIRPGGTYISEPETVQALHAAVITESQLRCQNDHIVGQSLPHNDPMVTKAWEKANRLMEKTEYQVSAKLERIIKDHIEHAISKMDRQSNTY